MATTGAVSKSRSIFTIVDAGYHMEKDPSEVLKDLRARGYDNVMLESIEEQFAQWDALHTDEPRW